jgi:hypothetical protein
MLKGLINEAKLRNLDSRQKDVAIRALRELEYKREHDPLSLYFPHRKQQAFHGFTAPVRCFWGGNQSGKTTGGLADDLIQALDEEDLPSHLAPFKTHQPPFLCRIMAPSFPVLETTLYQKLQELTPQHTLVGDSWSKAFDKNTRTLYFKNGSRFFFQTYMMDVAMMGGATLDRVHYDEEPPRWARVECRIRVMARGGEELFTMTPVAGLSWTYDEFWREVEEHVVDDELDVRAHGDVQGITVDMDDNWTLGAEEKRLALEGLSSEERQARKEGKFVALHGLIYPFRPERHVIPETGIDLPEHSTVVCAIDPGIRVKAAVLWLYMTRDADGAEQMVVYQEAGGEGMVAKEVASQIHGLNAAYGREPNYYVIDPAARNKEHITGRSVQMEYSDNGIVAIAGQNDVPAGINRVKTWLENGNLRITANCTQLIRELQSYRWKEPPRSGEDGPQKPVKKDDHYVDALRYAVMSRPWIGELPGAPDARTPLEKAISEDIRRATQPVSVGPAHGVTY